MTAHNRKKVFPRPLHILRITTIIGDILVVWQGTF